MTRPTPSAGAPLAGVVHPSATSSTPPQGGTSTGGVGHIDCRWCAGVGQVRTCGIWSDCGDCAGRGAVCSFCEGPLVLDDGQCNRCGTVSAERAAGIGPVPSCAHSWAVLSLGGIVIDERCTRCGVEVTS